MEVSTKQELRQSARICSEYGLLCSAKWALELSASMGSTGIGNAAIAVEIENSSVSEEEVDKILMAKSYFDVHEYLRAAHELKDCQSSRAMFLRGYSKYLAGEKKKEDERIAAAGPLGHSDVVNNELLPLRKELSRRYHARQLDGFGLYLLGIILKELGAHADARQILSESVRQFPVNWSAWLDLAAICDSREVVAELTLPQSHIMYQFFLAHLDLELQRNRDATEAYTTLLTTFPNSAYIRSQIAVGQYNMREFSEAQETFESLAQSDPHRLENMDTYSNILYVKEQRPQLSVLAHNAMQTDKYRPETCCVVGNYYSLKAQHDKAVIYFRRALQLNPNYLSAWTLMGHEYVEMHKTASAIEAYRRALDINSRDYRAWYGLGQTYEILTMHFYSLYYFRKAAALRPYDARMWCALGECYGALNRQAEAIKCFQRALENEDREGIALNKLGRLFADLGKNDEAAKHYAANLRKLDQEEIVSQQTADALTFLAHHCRRQMDLLTAERYCERLLDMPGGDKEDIRSLLREIRLMLPARYPYH